MEEQLLKEGSVPTRWMHVKHSSKGKVNVSQPPIAQPQTSPSDPFFTLNAAPSKTSFSTPKAGCVLQHTSDCCAVMLARPHTHTHTQDCQLLRVPVCSVTPSCPTLCEPLDCSPSGSSVHGIFQAGIPEWVAISSSRGSSQPRDQTRVSYISCIGRWGFYH